MHTAWRFMNNNTVWYVEELNTTGKGDPYSYTGDHTKALQMTDKQCRAFCAYMRDCGTVGFWN